jgi:cadmium resistance protein CadD (predicted permease)
MRRLRAYDLPSVPGIETVAAAAAAFAATNVDDIVVLSVLFARRDERFRSGQIVAGQLLGFAVLVLASLLASVGLLALPEEAIGALGLVPIALGLRDLWHARQASAEEDEPDGRQVMTTTGVAAVTIANGADNIAIYAPLFATIGAGDTAVTLVVFAVLVAAWCAVGGLIGSRPAVIRAVGWAGHYAIPFVLIALGVFIVVESGLPGTLLG